MTFLTPGLSAFEFVIIYVDLESNCFRWILLKFIEISELRAIRGKPTVELTNVPRNSWFGIQRERHLLSKLLVSLLKSSSGLIVIWLILKLMVVLQVIFLGRIEFFIRICCCKILQITSWISHFIKLLLFMNFYEWCRLYFLV